MKNVSLFLAVTVFMLGITSQGLAASNGTWACKLDSKKWKDAKGGANLNAGKLILYSSDDRIDGIYIQANAAVGSYALNDAAQATFAGKGGANHKSKTGSGTLVITKYSPPKGAVTGKVEGTFSGEFEAGAAKEFGLKDCAFSLPVKNL